MEKKRCGVTIKIKLVVLKYLVILIVLISFEVMGQNKNNLIEINVVVNNLAVSRGIIKLEGEANTVITIELETVNW